MSGSTVHDKHGELIQEGDHVYTKVRGGQHEGDVDKVVAGSSDAKNQGDKNHPKELMYPSIRPLGFQRAMTPD
ncbi:hypothetical protein PG994_013679 [Apiospora phragmitis]|uniref:Hypervirulence associated protein TUDOR domain-containing protein n=1 Tax=Apiospora phragmitis TaxID=2905665 RepID=A0ABR1T9C0_9PEZI